MAKSAFDAFLETTPEERRPALRKLRTTFRKHLPKGFRESIGGGMVSWVVPHSRYPGGYHCDPKSPLPFLSIASQKSHIAVYHMGLYSDPELLAWFEREWPKHVATKLDMGKSCVRFKKPEAIPFELLGELATRMGVDDWIARYEAALRR